MRDCVEVWILFAMANVLWKTVLTSSRLKVAGSLVVADQLIVTTPPVVALTGVLSVSAETRGRAKVARALRGVVENALETRWSVRAAYASLANILKS